MLNLLDYFNLSESYQLPDVLLGALLDKDERVKLLSEMSQGSDLSKDNFVESFQVEHGDKDKFKQDFTPEGISEIVARIIPQGQNIADICAGTGSLTIQAWNLNKSAFFHCEEKSERAVSFLLLNLALRNIHAEVLVGDALTRKYSAIYSLTPTELFSDITQVEQATDCKYQAVISNPPYSLKWKPETDERFTYGSAPAKAADYAFMQHGLSMLEEGGKAVFILPHGVLFRGQSEGKIRQKLIDAKIINSVIGLPDNTFLNTCIPVCLVVCENNSPDILFIDGSKECKKIAKLNVIESANVDKIVDTYNKRQSIERLANVVSYQDIQENDYNLNIPRYVDTFIPPEVPELKNVLSELTQINHEIKETQNSFIDMLNELNGHTDEELKAIELWIKSL